MNLNRSALIGNLNLKITFCFVTLSLLLAGCSINSPAGNIINDSKQPIQQKNILPSTSNSSNLSNAEKYCENNGGKVGVINECGVDVAICNLDDGTMCGLEDFFNGSCEKGLIVEWGEACRGE